MKRILYILFSFLWILTACSHEGIRNAEESTVPEEKDADMVLLREALEVPDIMTFVPDVTSIDLVEALPHDLAEEADASFTDEEGTETVLHADSFRPFPFGMPDDADEYEDAAVIAARKATELSPDYTLFRSGYTLEKPFYCFRFTRCIGGVPVNDDVTGDVNSMDIVVADEEAVAFRYRERYAPGRVLEEDVPLLHFPQIREIADQFTDYGPLSLQDANAVIREIRLGYRVLRQEGPEDIYAYTPVWDFYGYYEGKGESEVPEAYVPLLTIHAVTGVLIDRAEP